MDLGFLSPPALFFQHFPPNLILSAGVLDFFFPFCLHGVALPFLVCHVLDPDLDGPWLGCQRKALNDSPFPSADLFPSTAGAGRGHSMPVFFSSTALISILSFAFSDLWLPPSPLPPRKGEEKESKSKHRNFVDGVLCLSSHPPDSSRVHCQRMDVRNPLEVPDPIEATYGARSQSSGLCPIEPRPIEFV